MKAYTSENVYDAAIRRMVEVYEQGHRIIVAFSAGKDSTCALEVSVEAARITGRLPVEVWMQDEEIMYPGTYEYAERVFARDDIKFHWLVCGEPQLNIFNRADPYYWVFDDRLDPSEWMREPPSFARPTGEKDLYNVVNPDAFPPPPGKMLFVCMGVRAAESRKRNMIIHGARGHISKATKLPGVKMDRSLERHIRPIYDWTTKDVWLAIKRNGWDYNDAYDVMSHYGISRERQRIAPITMTVYGVPLLQMAYKAWPEWFGRLSVRLPGVALGAKYGKKAVQPIRRPHEIWEQAYQRLNIDEAPDWIAERAQRYREITLKAHRHHSDQPIMEVAACPTCSIGKVSWKRMTEQLYLGDPYLLETDCKKLGYVEPEQFRPGAGTWSGKPTF